MQLNDLRKRLKYGLLEGMAEVEVRGITHDSRDIKLGNLFVCLVGMRYDGHNYIGDAIAGGCSAIVVQEDHRNLVHSSVPQLIVPDTRLALPELAAAIFGDPSHDLQLIGVTGTNGKTTTMSLIASMLCADGRKIGTIGTLGAELMGVPLPSEHTTPEADQLQSLLATMRDRGAVSVVMEVSSHALTQHRTDSCEFDAAAFTNLTQDHLDFHRTMDAYFAAKRRLFHDYPAVSDKPFAAAINLDDDYGAILAQATKGRVITFGVSSKADVTAQDILIEPSRISFRAFTPAGDFDIKLHIGGAFQIYNALAAIGVGLGLGLEIDRIAQGLAALQSVPGRFESISSEHGFHVIVDYAHTPDGLKNLMESARRLNHNRLLVVFGCGGNRDRTKRPLMGSLVAKYADVAIVTSDNPRHEDPQSIIEEILPGMKETVIPVIVEPDRRRAISRAIEEARPGDIILLAGKGHENYQIIGDEMTPFDDRQIARELLSGCR